jgi:hypothetical protein
MRKWMLIFFTCFKTLASFSQPTVNATTGNTYTYAENSSIEETNFFVCGMSQDGKVYFHSHTGSLYIKGNNYLHKIRFPANAIPLHIWMIKEISTDQFYAFGDVNYYLISKDSVVKTFTYPHEFFRVFRHKENVVGITPDGTSSIYIFKGSSFVNSYTVNSKDSAVRLYVDSTETIWQVNFRNKSTDYYKVINYLRAEYQFSISTADKSPSPIVINLRHPYPIKLLAIESYSYDPLNVAVEFNSITPQQFVFSDLGYHQYQLKDLYNKTSFNIIYDEKIMSQNIYHPYSGSFYFGSFNKPFRYFPYILKYPRIFNNSSASSIHAIVQDSMGRIWAGSYEDGLSIIDKNKVVSLKQKGLAFLPGTFSTNKNIYLNTEKENGGFLQYDLNGRWKKTNADGHFISAYVNSKTKRVYLGSTTRGLWFSDIPSLDAGHPTWKIIDGAKGNDIFNSISSITEDKNGRIWIGGRLRGFAIYYPKKDTAKTWLISKGESSFGFWSSITDNRGTVWLGTDNEGLLFYNDYSTDTIDIKKIKRINHPLLSGNTKVMQLIQWGKWLVIGTSGDLLVMDLNQWYQNKSVIIRYLNPEEQSFTSTLQQNTILIDSRDSSIWFATGDMLYQWNIKQWLTLPMFRVHPNVILHNTTGDSTLNENRLIKLDPTNNTIKLSIWFQTKDNLPRYMSTALAKKGDSAIFSPAGMKTQFEFTNLASGDYQFFVRVFESDGTVSIHQYPIVIKRFWWQYWWSWLALFILISLPILLLIAGRHKARVVREKLLRKEAQLEAMRAEQDKKLASFKVISLSNQFRPHFILNALNTVGAELDDKPNSEIVLSRLGESINLIFNHAQQQKITHSFCDEWRLVKNVIQIHRTMYLKKLEVYLPEIIIIESYRYLKIPLGLLQLPVENALLHGLSNREQGPWKLIIEIHQKDDEILVDITDNGVGRAKAATLSNYRNHGTGIKNLNSILQIINEGNQRKISISYEDDIFHLDNKSYGTRVKISIPKNFRYEI